MRRSGKTNRWRKRSIFCFRIASRYRMQFLSIVQTLQQSFPLSKRKYLKISILLLVKLIQESNYKKCWSKRSKEYVILVRPWEDAIKKSKKLRQCSKKEWKNYKIYLKPDDKNKHILSYSLMIPINWFCKSAFLPFYIFVKKAEKVFGGAGSFVETD